MRKSNLLGKNMNLTKQTIPEYVYLEIADLIVKHIRNKTEELIIKNSIQPGGSVTARITFNAEIPVLKDERMRGPTKVEFKTKP